MKSFLHRSAGILMALFTALTAACFSGCRRAEPGAEGLPDFSHEPKGESYAERLFDASFVHEIDVSIDENDWAELKASPLSKTKYRVNVCIDGETVEGVSFSTKGNTSLSSVADDPESDRYSFKINFGKYRDGQTFRGLNKLNLNNLFSDPTYVKDHVSYEIFRRAGVEAPLTSFVWLKINGRAHGLYIAIEDVSESWLERTANGLGELYKPETSRLNNDGNDRPPQDLPDQNGQGNMPAPPDGQFPQPGSSDMPAPPEGQFPQPGSSDMPAPPEGQFPQPGSSDMPTVPAGQFPGQGFSLNGEDGGASLVYTDDDIESYPDIFDNDVTGADEGSNRRVIEALKALSEGKDIEKYVDVDEVVRYFAAHNFVLNYDSYTGNMLHNYYLYERDGRLAMLPWDYNLAFGAFAMGNFGTGDKAASLVNAGIDTPLETASVDSRPMWAFIAENEEYLEKYHTVYDELLSGYFENGEFEKQMTALYEMLLPYVKNDPSAFYTEESFTKAFDTLKRFCLLRAESIRAQLEGRLSASTNEQSEESRIQAADITISDMGSFGGGAGGQGGPGGQSGFPGGQGGFPGGQGGFPGGQGGFPGGQGGFPGGGTPSQSP